MATVSGQQDVKPHSQIYPSLPLDHSRHEIRLIAVLPSDTNEAPVSCELGVVKLTKDLQYAALSYVWGDPKVTEDIMVNGVTLPVTTNLASALRNFRQYGFPEEARKLQYLWADGICINQDNEDKDALTEKNKQVAFMGEIYKSASAVLSWLGHPGPDHVDEALRILKKYASKVKEFKAGNNADWVIQSVSWFTSESVLGPVLDPPGEFSAKWAPLRALKENDYWHRVWTLQEIVLCRLPCCNWVICGNTSVTLSELREVDALDREIMEIASSESETSFQGYSIESIRAFQAHLRSPMTISNRLFFEHLSGKSQSMFEGLFTMAWVLNQDRRATDSRDHIYGLLGIFPDTGIVPDYSKEKTVKAVFSDAIAWGSNYQLDTCLKVCGGCGYNIKNEHELPSWMPDLTRLIETPDIFHDKRQECKPLLENIPLSETRYHAPDLLHVQGVEFAQVELIKRLDIDETSQNEPKIWAQFCIDFLVEFLGPSIATKTWTSLDSERIPGRTRQQPLEALVNILVWQTLLLHQRANDYEALISGDSSVVLLNACLICLSGLRKFSKEEQDEAAKKLDLPPSKSLGAFLGSRYYDDEEDLLDNKKENKSEEKIEACATSFANVVKEYTLFKTQEGYIGKGPLGLQPGDLLCGLSTLTLPMILRRLTPADVGSLEESFKVVGRCYVPGLSDSEPAGMVKKGKLKIRDFLLR